MLRKILRQGCHPDVVTTLVQILVSLPSKIGLTERGIRANLVESHGSGGKQS